MRNFRADVITGSRSTLKAAQLFQFEGKINFFTCKVLLIESADSLKVASSGEKKRAGSKIQAEINHTKIRATTCVPKYGINPSIATRAPPPA